MFPNRVLVCCVLVACWCAPVAADEKPPLNPLKLLGLKDAPKKPAVIPVSKALDLDETTKTIRKLFPAGTVIVPLPDEHSLLVYVTEAQAKEIQLLANPPLEKPPAPKPMVPPAPPPLVEPKPVPESTAPVLKVITLEWRKAEEVAETIRVLIGERVQVIALKAQNRVVVLGSPHAIAIAVKIVDDQDQPLRHSTPRLVPLGPDPRQPNPPGRDVDPSMLLPKKLD